MRPDDGEPLDESRLIKGPGFVSVYVPPNPAPHPDDWKRDFPPGYPPEVHYHGVRANYWLVLREGSMPYNSWNHKFSDEVMEWLRSVQGKVEKILLDWR